MAKLAPARRAALDVLATCRRRDSFARDVLRGSSTVDALDPRDRALATRLVLGTVGALGALDAAIDSYAKTPSKIEPRVRDALRLAAYELMYLSTADAVGVSQGVELARRVLPQAAGMANAILRRIAQNDRPAVAAARAKLLSLEVEPNALALVGGLPLWLAERLMDSLGPAQAADFALGMSEPAPVFVAANTVKHAADDAFALLEDAGLEPIALPLPGAFKLGLPADLARSGLVGQADVMPCDLSSQAVAHIAAVGPHERLLEVGQGRGTKSILMAGIARRLGGPAEIVSCEVDEGKVRIAKARMAQAGVSGDVECLCLDASELSGGNACEAVQKEFDAVFIDAPCSGAGTLRRHPEITWSLTQDKLDASISSSLPALQLALLKAAATRVRPEGSLTYATCSPLIEEDEGVIKGFLASEAGRAFEIEGLECACGLAAAGDAGRALILEGLRESGFWRSTGALGSDLHFAARLIRRSR